MFRNIVKVLVTHQGDTLSSEVFVVAFFYFPMQDFGDKRARTETIVGAPEVRKSWTHQDSGLSERERAKHKKRGALTRPSENPAFAENESQRDNVCAHFPWVPEGDPACEPR